MKLSKLSLAILAAASVLSLAPSIHAQTQTNTAPTPPAGGARRGGQTAEARLTAFETALGSTNKLTEAQKPKVKVVLEEQTKKMRELMGQRDSLSQEDLRAKRTALTGDINKQMKEILNADQYKTWEQTAQRGRGRRAGGGAGGGNAGGTQTN